VLSCRKKRKKKEKKIVLSVAPLHSASAGPGADAACTCKQDNANFS